MALAEKLHHTSRGQRFARARGGGARGALRVTTTEAPSSPAGALPAVRRGARRFPAGLSGRAAGASGGGSAAHRGAARRRRSHGAGPGRSWVAGGGWGGGLLSGARRAGAGRAGHRRAQVLSPPDS